MLCPDGYHNLTTFWSLGNLGFGYLNFFSQVQHYLKPLAYLPFKNLNFTTDIVDSFAEQTIKNLCSLFYIYPLSTYELILFLKQPI